MGVGSVAEDWLRAEAEGFPGLLGKGLRNTSVSEGACLGSGAPASLPGSSPVSWPVVDNTNEPITQAFD